MQHDLRDRLKEITSRLKPQNLLFAKLLLEGVLQGEAYEQSIGKAKDPIKRASDLLRRNTDISLYVDISKEIAAQAALKSLEVTEERITHELACLGFSNIKRLYSEDGRLLEPHELDDGIAAAITKVKETILRTDETSGGVVIKREYEMADKKSALQLLGNSRAIQMFRENTVVTRRFEDLSEKDLDERIAELQRKTGAGAPT